MEEIFSDGETVFHPSEVTVDGGSVLHTELGITLALNNVNIGYFCRNVDCLLIFLCHLLNLLRGLHLHIIISHRDLWVVRLRGRFLHWQSSPSRTWHHILVADHFQSSPLWGSGFGVLALRETNYW